MSIIYYINYPNLDTSKNLLVYSGQNILTAILYIPSYAMLFLEFQT